MKFEYLVIVISFLNRKKSIMIKKIFFFIKSLKNLIIFINMNFKKLLHRKYYSN